MRRQHSRCVGPLLAWTLCFMTLALRPAQAATCTADSTGASDAYADIQACLNNGNTVSLASGGTYLINSPLSLTVTGTTLTSDGASHVTLLAGTSLNGRILNASTSGGFTVSHVSFIGRMRPPLYWSRNNLSNPNDCGSLGQNAYLVGSNYLVDDVESTYAPCGSGLVVEGYGYQVTNSYLHDNGWPQGSYPDGSWADGLTVLSCNNGGWIHGNTLTDNTDVDLVTGGGRNCTIENNTISNTTKHGFAGFHVGWYPNGNGDHSGSNYRNNTITSGVDMLAFGMAVGFEPWYNPAFPFPDGFTTNAGSVTGNTISGAVVNLAVEGIGNGYVANNTVSANQGSWGFQCSTTNNYTAHFFGAASIQAGWSPAWFFHGTCGSWNTSLPQPDNPGALSHGRSLAPGATLVSGSGSYSLIYQLDGNLVLKDSSGTPVWGNPGPVGSPNKAIMQDDANFVVYSATIWSTGTVLDSHSGAYFVVQDDGNLVVYYLDGTVLWSRF
jgi:hypothetical protein